MRLDKALGYLGYTRTEARGLVRAGRVAVDGRAVKSPADQVDEKAEFIIDDRVFRIRLHRHLMMNKPVGVLTATRDARAETAYDRIAERDRAKGLGPVGRLDKDVTGLLLFTTDGQLAHRLISPNWTVQKRYRARVEGPLGQEHVVRMAEGMALHDFTARPAILCVLESGGESVAELTITEGKFHQVKRMFLAIDRPVIALERLAIGPIELDGRLAPGQYRALSDPEEEALYQLVRMEREGREE